MVWGPRRDIGQGPPTAMLPLHLASGRGPVDGPGRWHFHPQSCPMQDGTRRIKVEARSKTVTFTANLTAGEAAALMFELGSALEQAARDERRAAVGLVLLKVLPGGRA